MPWLSSSLATGFSFTGEATKPDNPIACEPARADAPPSADQLAKDPAISEQTRRIAGNGNDRASYYKRGQLYAIKGAYPQAVSDFDRVIDFNARDAEAYNNRCWARAAVGDLQNALQDCDQALRLSPGLADALRQPRPRQPQARQDSLRPSATTPTRWRKTRNPPPRCSAAASPSSAAGWTASSIWRPQNRSTGASRRNLPDTASTSARRCVVLL